MEQEYKSKIKYLTINEIIDKYGDCLSMKEINYLFNLVLDSRKFNEPFITFYQVFCIRIKRDLKIKKLPRFTKTTKDRLVKECVDYISTSKGHERFMKLLEYNEQV